MSGLPLRVRLTLLVTVLFGLALTSAAAVGILRIEDSLRADTRQNAEALLNEYFDQVLAGTISPADPAPEDATRFVYLDEGGNELTTLQYQDLLFASLNRSPDLIIPPGADFTSGLDPVGSIPLDVESGAIAGAFQPVEPHGETLLLDRGDEVLAVGMPVLVGDASVVIAVSSPVQPVTDSVNTVRHLLFVVVPLLTAAIAGATWVIVGRALRPVAAISAQVDRISTDSLDQRVAEPVADDELGQLAGTMNRMLVRLEHARDVQRQFISDASHELRSPITATQATLEVARSHGSDADWTATAGVLHEENVRLASLVDDLLVLARLDETSLSSTQHVDLDELCITEAARPHARPVQVFIESPARITGNLDQLTRAVRNVVDNASDHAAEQVDVSLSREGDKAHISVVDDGAGIPGDDLERIFDRFSRLDSSRTRKHGGGAGLGLAIARQVIVSHGGTISAVNTIDGGAQFTITLPLSSMASLPNAAKQIAPSLTPLEGSGTPSSGEVDRANRSDGPLPGPRSTRPSRTVSSTHSEMLDD